MPAGFASRRTVVDLPRLPLRGALDLTYRCNNRCRHCWLRGSDGDGELTASEVLSLVDDARAMGCREWAISGGEPMLRDDFFEIFDHITSHARTYSLNTNGTLITEEIAELMRRPGAKMVALYGATAEVHDRVTRAPGSFAATMRGFERLREAGAGFIVQLVPMRDNRHQLGAMIALAKTLSPHWRLGASWLYLSASGDPALNAEIAAQRLAPGDVVELDGPDLTCLPRQDNEPLPSVDEPLFADCVERRRDFHVDPYGRLSFCCFVKDPALRYDLRGGSFREGWERFIPSLAGLVRGGEEYRDGCGSCRLRSDCRWCPAYAYLEHGRHSAKVEYLCEVSREARSRRESFAADHCRHFRVGGITVRVESDLPFSETTFHPKFAGFAVDGPGEDTVSIRHHFELLVLPEAERGEEVHRRPPWTIYRKGRSWIYGRLLPDDGVSPRYHAAIFSDDHTVGSIYSDGAEAFMMGNLGALTLFPTDEILIARLLADRDGFYLHSCGAVIDDRGLLFVGHSGAGKSTTARMIAPRAEILSDDRNIVRRHPDGWRVYGTWNHSDLPEVSARSAPLHAVLFLEQAAVNRIDRIEDRREVVRRLLGCVIRPLATAEWWHATLASVERLVREVPCYLMRFDRSGAILDELMHL